MLTKDQYEANFQEIVKTSELLQEERKRKEALGETVLLPSIYNNVMKQRIRNFFLFGLITAEQEQDLYQNLKK
jgi:hypothetical protein